MAEFTFNSKRHNNYCYTFNFIFSSIPFWVNSILTPNQQQTKERKQQRLNLHRSEKMSLEQMGIRNSRTQKKISRIWLGMYIQHNRNGGACSQRCCTLRISKDKGGSAILLNFPELAHSLNLLASNSPRDVQATAALAAAME
ncbi:ethylene-responsive transcription factor ERF037-like [Chenopodium quinoa]|uniref:ethylene-responsive transcription factor ERF037-like n=1 Tax=Chenopodium quinoa TaxID=63459 RepID=UPI000B782F02|nr:ethylene-responsive transcription factor ERF037-like [Chenopodium quinoa]